MFLKVRHMRPFSEEFVRMTEKRKATFAQHAPKERPVSQDFRKLDCYDCYSKVRLTTLTMKSKFSIPHSVKPRAVLKFLVHC